MNYRGSIDWDNLNALTTRLWLDAERSLSDNEIRALMGGTMTAQLTSPTLDTGYNAEADEGSFYYNFPQGYTDMETLRSDINDGRGSVVKCWDSNRPSWMTGCSGTSVQGQNEPDNATESHFGPNDIIAEEVRDFKNFLFNQRNEALRITSTESTEEDRNSLIAMLGEDSANPLFEECMNELFETDIIPGNYPDDYTEMDVMRDIRNIQNINDLTDDHISYIRLKLKKIAQTDETDAMSCMDKLNIGESICNTGIADKILRSAYLVASMMGMNNLDVSQIERGTGEYRKLTRLINDLGYLLPQAFKKIIDISLSDDVSLQISSAACSAFIIGHCIDLSLEDVAYTKVLSFIASFIELYIEALSRTSVAFPAKAVDSFDGKTLGFTKESLERPIVFIALATEPIFPG